MKAIEINEDNLEDLLTYDDLFLDYFNAFLGLPVFPQPLYYNRLTGTFLEVNDGDNTVVDDYPRPVTPPYGATDEEREHMLEWAKDERLPLFLRTQLFREFKLCKLLLRPLDDRCSASRGSSSHLLRGYSRQTESYVSSFSNSADNSANDADFEDENMWGDIHKSALFQYRRPGSRAISLPTRLGLAPEYSLSVTTESQHADTKESSNVTKHPASAQSGLADRKLAGDKSKLPNSSQTPSSPEPLHKTGTQTSALARRLSKGSAKSKHASRHSSAQKDDNKSVVFQAQDVVDFDVTYGEQEPDIAGETYVSFGNDAVSDQQTETDVKELEGKHKMSLQEMKEQVLGSVSGMEQFKRFLIGTAGGHLFNFWLDCENFKDTMEDFDEYENMVMRNALYRDIQDRYKLALTEDAKRQIAQSANNAGLSHTVFIRTQYDVLRRLRAYWLPRFLIHKERMNELSDELKRENMEPEELFIGHDSTATSFFPSISLVNSMPVRAEQIMHIACTTGWDSISKGGRKLDDRIKSAKPKLDWRPTRTTLREKFALALLSDKAAGGPFKMFLETHQNGELLNRFLFWEAVTEYGMAEDRSADRLLRMCHAWNIFNRFISKDGPNSIGVPPDRQDYIHQALLKSNDFVEASIFNTVQQETTDQLEKAWIRFLKEDLKAYLDCQVRAVDSPPSTADEIEVYLDEEREHLVVRRPRPWTKRYPPSTESERGRRLRTALSMAESIDEARRAEIRQRNRERRKIMEKERRKAVRAAMRRMKEAKMKKNMALPSQNQSQQGDGSQSAGQGTGQEEQEEQEKTPTLQESFNNKGLMQMFKKYLADTEGKDAANLLNLCLDIEAYYTMMDNKTTKHKKDMQASHIFKSYLEQGARKKIHLSDTIYAMLKTEKERPRTATLKEIQTFVSPKLEELFKTFLEYQAAEMGLDNKSMATMSKAELAMRADDSMLVGEWAKKKRNGKDAAGHLPPLGEEDSDDPSSQLGNVSSKLLKLAMSEDDFVFKKARKNKGANSTPKEKSDLSGHSRSDLFDISENKEGHESSSESVSPNRRRHKADGRAQPTKEDKVDFLLALNQAAAGNLPIKMWYFYKYLVKHGEDDGAPFVDKDLFFYCEVHKFKDCNHQYADEELLKRKVQSLLDCYLECTVPPHCQLDIPNEIQQKTVRAAQRYLAGKDNSATMFDEAQYCVFKELLPYWAGFQKTYKEPQDAKTKPLTKKEKERLKRLQEIMNWKPPSAKQLSLPMIPKGTSIAAFTFTIGDGIKWRETTVVYEMKTKTDTLSVTTESW